MLDIKPGTLKVAVPFTIVVDKRPPSILAVTSPVAFSKPITTTVAFSPAIIGSAVAFRVKFSLGGIGFSLTVTLTFVEFNAYTPSPPTLAVIIAVHVDFAVTLPFESTVTTDSLLEL